MMSSAPQESADNEFLLINFYLNVKQIFLDFHPEVESLW